MKKSKLFKVIALLLVAIIGLTSCGNGGGSNETTKEETSKLEENTSGQEDVSTKDPSTIKIGMITDVGGVNDGSFNQSSWEGLQRAGEELKVTVKYLESKNDSDYTPNIETFVDEKYDLIIDCSNTKSGLMFSLNHAEQASTICIMSHLYGHNTSFVYEQLCKKELKGLFPLRNGETNNLLLAKNYIKEFWTNKDDDLIQIYQNIYEAFDKKEENSKCKQIIDVQKALS